MAFDAINDANSAVNDAKKAKTPESAYQILMNDILNERKNNPSLSASQLDSYYGQIATGVKSQPGLLPELTLEWASQNVQGLSGTGSGITASSLKDYESSTASANDFGHLDPLQTLFANTLPSEIPAIHALAGDQGMALFMPLTDNTLKGAETALTSQASNRAILAPLYSITPPATVPLMTVLDGAAGGGNLDGGISDSDLAAYLSDAKNQPLSGSYSQANRDFVQSLQNGLTVYKNDGTTKTVSNKKFNTGDIAALCGIADDPIHGSNAAGAYATQVKNFNLAFAADGSGNGDPTATALDKASEPLTDSTTLVTGTVIPITDGSGNPVQIIDSTGKTVSLANTNGTLTDLSGNQISNAPDGPPINVFLNLSDGQVSLLDQNGSGVSFTDSTTGNPITLHQQYQPAANTFLASEQIMDNSTIHVSGGTPNAITDSSGAPVNYTDINGSQVALYDTAGKLTDKNGNEITDSYNNSITVNNSNGQVTLVDGTTPVTFTDSTGKLPTTLEESVPTSAPVVTTALPIVASSKLITQATVQRGGSYWAVAEKILPGDTAAQQELVGALEQANGASGKDIVYTGNQLITDSNIESILNTLQSDPSDQAAYEGLLAETTPTTAQPTTVQPPAAGPQNVITV